MTDRTAIHAPKAQELVRELLDVIGEDERTARRIEIDASAGGLEITVERLTGAARPKPDEPRPTELRHYLVSPQPTEVVDLVAALRATVDAARARREGRS